jgi:CheY-like chemotaxis protein
MSGTAETSMKKDQHITILLVEDDPGHARLIEKNLRRAGIVNEIVVLKDGGEAVEYLLPDAGGKDAPHERPFCVLLDLNMPVLDGYQVLKRIKGDERTRSIPVVILTTTDNPLEVARCYGLGCNVYISKPVEYDRFVDAIQKLGMFLSIVKVPQAESDHG